MAMFIKLLQVIVLVITPASATTYITHEPTRYYIYRESITKPSSKFVSCVQQSRAATMCYTARLCQLESTLALNRQRKFKEAQYAFDEYNRVDVLPICMPARENLLENCPCSNLSMGFYCPSSAELIAKFNDALQQVLFNKDQIFLMS